MSTSPAPLHTLRSIIRHLKNKCPSSAQSPSPNVESLKTQVLQQYRLHQNLSPTSPEALHQRTLASHYSKLTNNLSERQILYELDASAETQLSGKEMSRRAAARAGLQLPETYQV